MKLCDRCSVPGCCLDYLGVACRNARQEHCPDVQPNNAENITNMDYGELADFLVDIAAGKVFDKKKLSPESVKTWLNDPHHA